jgi:hypothetical protein
MSTGRSNFRETDVKRAVRAVEAAGKKVARVDFGGKTFSLVVAGAEEGGELDRELKEFEQRHGQA